MLNPDPGSQMTGAKVTNKYFTISNSRICEPVYYIFFERLFLYVPVCEGVSVPLVGGKSVCVIENSWSFN